MPHTIFSFPEALADGVVWEGPSFCVVSSVAFPQPPPCEAQALVDPHAGVSSGILLIASVHEDCPAAAVAGDLLRFVPDVSQPFEVSLLPQPEVPFGWFQSKELSRDFVLPNELALNDVEGPSEGREDIGKSGRRGRLT